MTSAPEPTEQTLPPPWDRIFSLTSKAFVWATLIAVLYVLRPFLLLVFLTFVFAYIQAHGVDGLAHRIKSRTVRVVFVGLVVLGTLFAIGFTLVPQVKEQANDFFQKKDKYIAQADQELDKFFKQYPSIYGGLAKNQKVLTEPVITPTKPSATGGEAPEKKDGEAVDPANGETQPQPEGATQEPKQDEPPKTEGKPADKPSDKPNDKPTTETKPGDKQDVAAGGTSAQAPGTTAGAQQPIGGQLHIVRKLYDNAIESISQNPTALVESGLGYASSFLLSLLFSFLIVLDLPKLKKSIQGISNTKLGFVYDEVADNIAGFGLVLGRALEAQLFIAICNTILTAIGIWAMGLPNILVLSTIVFFCSFIPVAGTFISSTPICLLALQDDGVGSMMIAILLICIIHAIETYVLNPQIYGHHMHMTPVLVLIVLTIGGKLFGVWGLVLGIPIVNYVFRHAIRRPEERPAET
ncbi:MAG: AI-2E family transporter [Planctomycetes bacterium]|nr:AI-2E family transporter [Planctomycetota bacterium]